MSAKRVEGLNRCPNCGAPLDLDPSGRSRWCEVPVEVSPPGPPDSPTEISETFEGATATRPRGKARHLISALITVGVAGGLVAAQWLHAGHSPSDSGQGSDLTTAWTATSDRSSALDTSRHSDGEAPLARRLRAAGIRPR